MVFHSLRLWQAVYFLEYHFSTIAEDLCSRGQCEYLCEACAVSQLLNPQAASVNWKSRCSFCKLFNRSQVYSHAITRWSQWFLSSAYFRWGAFQDGKPLLGVQVKWSKTRPRQIFLPRWRQLRRIVEIEQNVRTGNTLLPIKSSGLWGGVGGWQIPRLWKTLQLIPAATRGRLWFYRFRRHRRVLGLLLG